MEQIASDTGGKAYYNTNDLATAVKRAFDDGSHYYTMVYTPTNNKMDGSYRKINVQVTANGKFKTWRIVTATTPTTLARGNQPTADPLRPLLISRPAQSPRRCSMACAWFRPTRNPPPMRTRAGKNTSANWTHHALQSRLPHSWPGHQARFDAAGHSHRQHSSWLAGL